jgi:CBS domain-containing protein
MSTHQISCAIVVEASNDEDSVQQPIGIVTERDIVRLPNSQRHLFI